MNAKELFEFLFKSYEDDTCFLSWHERNHDCYKVLMRWTKKEPDQVIPWLLEHIEASWLSSCILFDVIPETEHPAISHEDAGRHDVITAAWLAWGKAKGYS